MGQRLFQPGALRSRLRDDQTLVGCMINAASPWLVEMAAQAGFDYATIDLEHEAISQSEVAHLIRAADSFGLPVIVRTRCDHGTQRLLNLGPEGIQVPDVTTASEAKDVVDTVRFHPLGRRGYQRASRNAGYGVGISEQDYFESSNRDLLVISMIEDVAAVEHLDELASVAGIDAFYVGPGDLAQSMGFPGQQAVSAVVDEVIDRLVAAGKTVGLGVYAGFDEATLIRRQKQGVRLFSVVLNRIIAHHLVQVRESITAVMTTTEPPG